MKALTGGLSNAFTKVPGKGNPAGVIVSQRPLSEKWMKIFAKEINQPETAFLTPIKENEYSIRWFTPSGSEVDLCGHGTLAAAHFLQSKNMISKQNRIKFNTKNAGILWAQTVGDEIELEFPATPPEALNISIFDKTFIKALGLSDSSTVLYFGKSCYDFLIEVSSPEEVFNLKPDLNLLSTIETRGFIITASYDENSENGYDFVSRFFGPRIGIPEDPVTGSAHCTLAPYWRNHLGKNEMVGYQASERSGVVRCIYDGNDRVLLRGNAVKVWDMCFDHLDIETLFKPESKL